VRDPDAWYKSASNTIFLSFDHLPPELQPWMTSVRELLRERFSDRFDDSTAMIDAFVRHNDAVRLEVPAERLLEWAPGDGWEPICERLGLPVPNAKWSACRPWPEPDDPGRQPRLALGRARRDPPKRHALSLRPPHR
jgi:hypothetical protein